jgi:hypothetical protein
MIPTIGVAVGAYLFAFVLYMLFLSYCTLRQMKDSGRLAAMPVVARVHCYALLGFTLALDILFNVTIGTLLFVELPDFSSVKSLTFTARCKRWQFEGILYAEGRLARWRGNIARWVCNGWLNPGEPGHC